MAKHVIIEGYTFTPGTKTVVVNGKTIRQEQLLLITNVTANVVIYNFSDPSLGATSYVQAFDTATALETTTIVLDYNTAGMNSTDKLSILVEETYQEITPSETLRDPVDKLRVSTPQSLIDTDFEYGTQPTKWETLYRVNNRPTGFIDVQSPLTFTNITGTGSTRVVTVATTTPPTVGTFIFVTGTLDVNADGWYRIESVSAGTNFTYVAKANVTNGSVYDSTKSYIWTVNTYSGSAIPVATGSGAAFTNSGTTVTCTTTNDHGLSPGNGIWVTGTTAATSNPPNGAWVVATTPTNNTFTFTVITAPVGAITASAGATSTLFPRPFGFIVHRAFDGGVQFSAGTSSHNYQTTRQTRRYFRYQSGKGLQFSTGTILKPSLTVESLRATGANVLVTSKYPHLVNLGTNVLVTGAVESAYNGSYPVVSVGNVYTFTYQTPSVISTAQATGFPINVHASQWSGSLNRVGMFDEQNGFFFEFDGTDLWVVRRSSTQQLTGVVAPTVNSNRVIGTGTNFNDQLIPGDYVVIRGMSYLVESIVSNNEILINPEYKGVTAQNCVMSKTIDTKVPQYLWNIDRMDGTGASGYNIDLTKMQMFYIDYSWYGAGAIRFGFKNARGEVIYCHRFVNNNQNTEAYMRSGNMAARYETSTRVPYTIITSTLSSASGSGASVNVRDASRFPNVGTIVLTASGGIGQIEYISYSSKSGNSFIINQRAIYGGVASANTFTYSATAPVSVELFAPQQASTISHWGSSVIMDGKYDDDKSLIFNIGQNNSLVGLAANRRAPIISLRVSPTVDSGLTGLLGVRETINRMQLVLRQMDAVTSGPYRVEVILNGRPSDGIWLPVGGSSLAQYAFHASGATITGGENIFSFFTQSNGQTQQDMQLVRDLGTSILGGGTSANVNTLTGRYPDGPDMITICATPFFGNSFINSRISWTEAQA